MQLLHGRIEAKRTGWRAWKHALWIVALSVGTCQASPQQHAEAVPQEKLTTQDSLSVQVVKADDVPVRAGEDFNFTFKLDKAPTFSEGGIEYLISGPGGKPTWGAGVPLVAGEQECKARFHIPFAAPGGTWTIRATQVSDGVSTYPVKSSERTFQVIANEGLVLPTSADIVVNPSQQQLLRLEARHLQHRIEDLKSAILAYQQANQQGRITQVLRTNIDESVKALDQTEAEFESRATAKDQSALAKVFFSDLRLNYETVDLNLDRRSEILKEYGQLLNAALQAKAKVEKPYSLLAQAALRAFEGNERAYDIVAEGGSLTFDLKVTSNPSGAVVSYHRRGDPPHLCPDPTTAVIPSLPYAVWYVKVEKLGYKAQEREHDAIRSTDHVVNIELTP
jgi:hypothetical protein